MRRIAVQAPALAPRFAAAARHAVEKGFTAGPSAVLRAWAPAAGLAFQMPGTGHWQRKSRSPVFPISRGSFSSVSTLLIARVGACFSIFQNLQDCYAFAPLQCKVCFILQVFFEISGFLQNFADSSANRALFAVNFTEFCWNCGK